MEKFKKWGGLSALALTVIYLIGIVMKGTLLNTDAITDGNALLVFLGQNESLMIVWISLLYIVFGIALAFLSVAVHEVLKDKNPVGARLTLVFGVIWSTLVIASGMIHNTGMMMALDLFKTSPEAGVQFYKVIQAIHLAIGGNNEVIGGLWTLLISYYAIKQGEFKKWINVLGFIVGIAGLLTMVPLLFDGVVMVFALGQMVWWIGLGIVLVRSRS